MFVAFKLNKILFFALVLGIIIMAALFILKAQNEAPAMTGLYDVSGMPVLIIDPGHGGEDGGAVSLEGTRESVINLDIALRMEALANFIGLPSNLTRDSEDIEYPDSANTVARRKRHDQKTRVELINSTPCAVVISIHQNCFPNSKPHGPQSFYSKAESAGCLGKLVQGCLDAAICPDNRRLTVPVAENIFLMRSIECPAVLVECGFLSNPTESKLLGTEEYRLKIATALICAYGQFLDENPT